jgi:hypothetical protein
MEKIARVYEKWCCNGVEDGLMMNLYVERARDCQISAAAQLDPVCDEVVSMFL